MGGAHPTVDQAVRPQLCTSPPRQAPRREFQQSTEQKISAPVFVFNGIERRQTDDAESLREDRVGLGDPQLDDRRQSHGAAVRFESPNVTVMGASCHWPFPRLTQR